MERFYLNVPFKEKDIAKGLGAFFDGEKKKWYYTNADDKEKFERWIAKECLKYEQLSDEQKQLIIKAKEGKNVLVDACIGSGKTTAIQVLCNEIKDKRILYLTYNKLLKNDAREKIQFSNVDVTNYHGFAYSCLKNDGINFSGIGDLIQDFLKYKPQSRDYDLLIIDEYQDIEQEIAEMLLIIKKRNPDIQIIVVGDMEQKIYDKTTLNVKDFIIDFLDDYETLSFTKCFRINNTLAEQLGKVWKKEINGVNENCEVKIMETYDVIEYLATKKPSDILCLGSRTGEMSYVLNCLEEDYYDKFNKNTVYASIRDKNENINITQQTAIFTTYDSSKGLERPVCVVFDFDESYWNIRLDMSQQKYEILRNIFLVACSRGKEEIIFAGQNESVMNPKTILEYEKIKKHIPFKPFNISEMFDFKYKEDVERCFSLIQRENITADNIPIEVDGKDGLIDISPCVGIWQEINFFKNYSIDDAIKHLKEELEISDRTFFYYKEAKNKRTSLAKKILILTANTTRQKRYYEQVATPFISKKQQKEITERLSTEFTPDEIVQCGCEIKMNFMDNYVKKLTDKEVNEIKERDIGAKVETDENGEKFLHISEKAEIVCSGRCDVIKNDIIYELKFKSSLAHEDFLQLSCYLVAMEKEKGILWNVKTNEKYVVSVPDRKSFMNAVVNCITKGYVKEWLFDF